MENKLQFLSVTLSPPEIIANNKIFIFSILVQNITCDELKNVQVRITPPKHFRRLIVNGVEDDYSDINNPEFCWVMKKINPGLYRMLSVAMEAPEKLELGVKKIKLLFSIAGEKTHCFYIPFCHRNSCI